MLRRLPRLFSFSLPPFQPDWTVGWHPHDVNPPPLNGMDRPPTQANTPAQSLHLAPGASFEHIQAERIVLGAGPICPSTAPQHLERWQPPVGVRPWGVKGWRIGHSLGIPQAQWVPCALAVRGQLDVHGHCVFEGDVQVRNSLRMGPGCHVNGNLLSEDDMRIDPGCCIQGLVMAEGKLHLSPGVVIGSPQHPVSVCADVIQVVGPVFIHGSVHARIQGGIDLLS